MAEIMSRYTNTQTEVVGADPKSYNAWTCCVLWSYKVSGSVVSSKDTDQTNIFRDRDICSVSPKALLVNCVNWFIMLD